MKALIPQGLIGRPNYFGLLNNSMTLIIRESLRQIGEMTCVTSAWSSRGQTLKLQVLGPCNKWPPNINPLVQRRPVPCWTIAKIEQIIYDFFWGNKRHLVNKDILSLPLQHDGFNIPRIATKIQALRLNTLRRLLTEEDAHWKHFAGYFLRVSNMQLGKLTLVLHYSPRQIDRDIPTFHRELLFAWHKHQHLHTRSHIPRKLPDILKDVRVQKFPRTDFFKTLTPGRK